MPPTYDTLVIGAGLAALTAARSLDGFKVALLEARPRVGGRALTASQTPEPVDLGCSMIHGFREGNPAARLITQDLQMDVHIPEGAKGLVYGPDGPLSEADATSLFATSAQNAFSPPPSAPADASIASLLFSKLKDERLIALARTAEIGAGATLEEQSARFAGFEQGFAGTDAFPQGGYGAEVVRNLVAGIKAAGGELHLNAEVTSVEDLGKDEGVKVSTKDGKTFTAKTVISTIPHAVLREAPPTFSPPLSPIFTNALERMRTGALEKIVLTYPSAWWPSPDETGSFLLLPLVSSSSSSDKPSSLHDLFTRTTIPVTSFQRIGSPPHPTLLAYIGADAARFISTFPDEEVTSAFHSYLIERLAPSSSPSAPAAEVPQPTVALVTSWLRDPFSRGATSTPVLLTTSEADGERATPLDFVIVGRPPKEWEGRLGFAGEHTVLDNHGSVAGAVISGKREGERVRELLERLAEPCAAGANA
ncbi:hypothetical protein JCM8097_002159 [Rhodosporidiobolus ruineniae]